MNARTLRTLIAKDFTLYFRNRFFAFITVAGLIIYVLLYAVLPATVDETLTLAVYAPTIPPIFLTVLSGNEITIATLESEAALRDAVLHGQYPAGVALPGEVVGAILRGEETRVTVYFASDAPPEVVAALRSVLRLAFNELSYTLSGRPLNLNLNEQIIGRDMTGQAIAFRSRLLPLLAILLLLLESMGLGSLITEEIEAGTLNALLVTPVTVSGLFASKAIFGILLAFVQAALLMALTGSLRHEPILILTTLLISALTVTGFAFLIASFSRSMMSVMAWGVLLVFVMLVPSYGVVIPGMMTEWARAIPSYYMFDTLHQVVNFGASWGTVSGNLIVLFLMGIGFMTAGILVMHRRLR
jgi:ABC-2 type transport system permease protein